jgi:two-component system cell cycle sensor histidine kinase/response regulator CckA
VPARGAYSDTQRPVVILVEDEHDVRDLVARMLSDHGWTVYDASSGVDALRLFEAHRDVDLLVTDLHMPGLDGLKLAEILRRQRPDLKILYITGYEDRLFESNPVLPDNEAFLAKPFTMVGLVEAASLLVFGSPRRTPLDSPRD